MIDNGRFATILKWELQNLFRFPFPEVLIAVFIYMAFLPHEFGWSSSFAQELLSWPFITSQISFATAKSVTFFISSFYVPMGIFASILCTVSFAYEIENGLLKVHLSHPGSRTSIFSSKLLSCFLIVFTTYSTSLFSYIFLEIPENVPYVILSPDFVLLRILLLATSLSLFMVSLTVSFSLFSAKASVSLVGSFATIYLIQLLSTTANLKFLPPICFREQAMSLFDSRHPDLTNILTVPLISVFLVILSYLYFSRRLEIS